MVVYIGIPRLKAEILPLECSTQELPSSTHQFHYFTTTHSLLIQVIIFFGRMIEKRREDVHAKHPHLSF